MNDTFNTIPNENAVENTANNISANAAANNPANNPVNNTAASGISSAAAPAISGYSQTAYPVYTPKKMTEEEKEKRVRHFRFFSIGSIIYAIFYTFCLFKNNSGITYPFFIGGTLFYFFLSLKRLGISAKKDSIFYVISLLLLGISTFCTDDMNIISLNKMGIFVLSFVLIIHNFYRDNDWNLTKYIASVLQTIFGSIGEVGSPVSDFTLYLKSRKENEDTKNTKGRYIVIGLLISIPLLFVVTSLLYSADIVFASVMDKILENIKLPENMIGMCFTALFAFFSSYCILVYMDKKKIEEDIVDRRTGEPVLAITITSLLSVIYLFFSGIQIIYLFLGNMELPNNYTYAEYAREGFFQLLFICILNLIVVLICIGRFRESRPLKIILTIISACTYIMIASSAIRMLMYIGSYYLTFMRILVLWSLLVMSLLMAGVVITIYKERFPLFKYSMVLITVLYIGLSFAHPDYIIAKYNVAHYGFDEEEDTILRRNYYSDLYYLSHLSADAAPVFYTEESLSEYRSADYKKSADKSSDSYAYYESWLDEYSERQNKRLQDMNLRTFNVSRHIAKQYIDKLPSEDDAENPDATLSETQSYRRSKLW